MNVELMKNKFFFQNYGKNERRFGCKSNDLYDREIHRIENLQFKIKDPIKLGKDFNG